MNYVVLFTQTNRHFQAHILKISGLGKYIEHCVKTTDCYHRLDIHPSIFTTLDDATKFVRSRGYVGASNDGKYIFNYGSSSQYIKSIGMGG